MGSGAPSILPASSPEHLAGQHVSLGLHLSTTRYFVILLVMLLSGEGECVFPSQVDCEDKTFFTICMSYCLGEKQDYFRSVEEAEEYCSDYCTCECLRLRGSTQHSSMLT